MFKSILLVLNFNIIMLVTCKHCFWNAGCSYKFFSSKTPYGSVRGDIRDNNLKVKGCEPISIWSIYRYGQRNPSTDLGGTIKEVMNLKDDIVLSHSRGTSALCAQDIENLNNWLINKTISYKANALTDEGYSELLGIGKRLKEVYPKFLSTFEAGSYTFRPAFGHWIEESAKAFVEGLVQNSNEVVIDKPWKEHDYIAPYMNCNKYTKNIEHNISIYGEQNKYKNSQDFIKIKERIQNRLGIKYMLTEENVTMLYDICRYTSSANTPSPWCALFTTDDLRVLEYIGDLKHYYKNGYGTPLNQQLGEIPLKDLFNNFELAKAGKGKKIIAYFSHATMMDMIYTALELFKDDIPLSGMYQLRERKWRTSIFSSFASNIIVVLNKCTKDSSTEYIIMFYVNEKRLRLCSEGWCTWKEFEARFTPFLNKTLDFCDK